MESSLCNRWSPGRPGRDVFSFAAATFAVCLSSRRTRALSRRVSISGMVVAVLLLAAFVVAPALLLPIWVIVAGLGARRAPAVAQVGAAAHAAA